STKDRAKSITPPLRPKLHAYIVGICNNDGIIVHAIGGAQDHIHCLLQIPPTHSVAKTVLTIKANSSRWLRQTSRDFAWQQGYAAFSVSASMILTVSRYIQNQEAHHHKMTFQEEFWRSCGDTGWSTIQNSSSDECRAYGAPVFGGSFSQPLRAGLICVAPTALPCPGKLAVAHRHLSDDGRGSEQRLEEAAGGRHI